MRKVFLTAAISCLRSDEALPDLIPMDAHLENVANDDDDDDDDDASCPCRPWPLEMWLISLESRQLGKSQTLTHWHAIMIHFATVMSKEKSMRNEILSTTR